VKQWTNEELDRIIATEAKRIGGGPGEAQKAVSGNKPDRVH
jgi:hypothetical protein